MAKIQLPRTRRYCIACGLMTMPSAEGSPLCEECHGHGIAYAIDLIERHRTFSDPMVEQASVALAQAIQRLNETDKQRWRAFDQARKQVADGTADDSTKRRVDTMVKALKEKHVKVQSLVNVFVAEEAWWWASQNQEIRYRRADELLATLEAWQKEQEVTA